MIRDGVGVVVNVLAPGGHDESTTTREKGNSPCNYQEVIVSHDCCPVVVRASRYGVSAVSTHNVHEHVESRVLL